MKQFLTTLTILVAAIIFMWLAIWLFAGLAVVGGIAYILYLGRDYLTRKGILNPTPGQAPGEEPAHYEEITVIDAEFERLPETQKSSGEDAPR